ncbi:hypothetical protein SAMN05421670_3009 [Psychrobacillus psychrotolerans]|uniref:Uncharacterized protein n=1 Tax=Psychrobacillus psychrotolerans TaxID=126156 RepID=A0A1I5ZZZ1_9BACI|nr:hypothetical protein [Psychrobacillus psychrotolerans]SFQ61923.1 hypothetical protein SAMN05421670_3009 [Psychrobacillus psychrotolerans]
MNLNQMERFFEAKGSMTAIEFVSIEYYCISATLELALEAFQDLKYKFYQENYAEETAYNEWWHRNINQIAICLAYNMVLNLKEENGDILKHFYGSNKSNEITCAKFGLSAEELFEIRYAFCSNLASKLWYGNKSIPESCEIGFPYFHPEPW